MRTVSDTRFGRSLSAKARLDYQIRAVRSGCRGGITQSVAGGIAAVSSHIVSSGGEFRFRRARGNYGRKNYEANDGNKMI